jgi:hypothetical protein
MIEKKYNGKKNASTIDVNDILEVLEQHNFQIKRLHKKHSAGSVGEA